MTKSISRYGGRYVGKKCSFLEALTMICEPYFVPDGVYLRTSTGEVIGQLDKPGEPFVSLG